MPVMIPWMTRADRSSALIVATEKLIEAMVVSAAPSATRPSVFKPVGLPRRLRSMPITQPIATATAMRRMTSARTELGSMVGARPVVRRTARRTRESYCALGPRPSSNAELVVE